MLKVSDEQYSTLALRCILSVPSNVCRDIFWAAVAREKELCSKAKASTQKCGARVWHTPTNVVGSCDGAASGVNLADTTRNILCSCPAELA